MFINDASEKARVCLFLSHTQSSLVWWGQMLLADDLFVEMAGVFEYDAELKEKGQHRKFLTQTASFKQVMSKRVLGDGTQMMLLTLQKKKW